MNDKEKAITTIGIVIPVEWEENGKPIAYALSSYDEKEYLIDEKSDIGKKLSTVEKIKLRVTGTLGPVVHNRRVLYVNGFEEMLPPDEP